MNCRGETWISAKNPCFVTIQTGKTRITDDLIRARPRRSASVRPCVPKDYGQCCLHEVHINFSQVEWNKWILHPEEYQANYCSGNCRYVNTGVYSSLFRNAAHKRSGVEMRKELLPCCSPSKDGLQPLAIIYVHKDQSIRQELIPNMKVARCHCDSFDQNT